MSNDFEAVIYDQLSFCMWTSIQQLEGVSPFDILQIFILQSIAISGRVLVYAINIVITNIFIPYFVIFENEPSRR
jgi:hypothetical protein